MTAKIKWCCPAFKNGTEWPDERGHRVVSYAAEPTKFFLVFRSVNQEDVGKLKTDFPVSVLERVVLSYCPWCGANLVKRYARQAIPRDAKDPMLG